MSVSLSDYKGHLENGIYRANSYRVIIDQMPENVSFFIINAQLPAATANPMLVYHQGRELKLAGMPRWQTWNTTLYGNITSGNRLETYSEFWSWMNTQIGLISNIGNNNPTSYWREIRIIPLFDDRTTELGEFVLLDAFITEMQPVDVSWESEDPMRFNVVIQFSEASWRSGDEIVFGDNEG